MLPERAMKSRLYINHRNGYLGLEGEVTALKGLLESKGPISGWGDQTPNAARDQALHRSMTVGTQTHNDVATT